MIKKVRKLNQKGLTAIEVLLCFTIVIVIVMSMTKVVNNQRDKQEIASIKNSITTYKNTITKVVEEDLRKNGGIVEIVNINDQTDLIVIDFKVKNGSCLYRKITIQKKSECDEDSGEDTANQDIKVNCEEKNYIQYEILPSNLSCYNKEIFNIPNVYNLKFNKLESTSKNGYLNLYVGFNHPDLGNRYSALDLTAPVNSDYF